MKKEGAAIAVALEELLEEKLPKAQVQSLKDEGFTLKKPTRKAALAIAIYKKAASGDLSAIKELRSILAGENAKTATKAVIIIDDTAD
ncbi:MAG: hypothetical protein J6T73_02770 [Clostridia bacterium]|nr:hypothetical protein [Clostridia bacterium]